MTIVIPAKVLEVNVTSLLGYAKWPFDDGEGDPFWSGGSTPKDYQWQATFSVSAQSHSSHLTRVPNVYNGMDIHIGDYIANTNSGIALKIISIESKSETQVIAIVEDVFRYNTFRSAGAVGDGKFNTGAAIVFELNSLGQPVVDPLPASGVSAIFTPNLFSRFENFSERDNFVLEKAANGYVVGQIIAADPANNSYTLSDSNNTQIIGRVSYAGPGPNQFVINPLNKIIDNFDFLIGDVGDTVYTDDMGGLTLTNTGKPIYVKLRNNTQTSITGSEIDASTTSGNVIEINDVPISILNTGSISDAITAINAKTSSTGVTASSTPAPTVVETNLSGFTLHYGEPALYTTDPAPTATINGVTVTFDIDTAGQAAYGINLALEQDMAASINAANIPNLRASVGSNTLILTETSGGSITIVNGQADQNGVFFAGLNSGSGLPLNTAAASGELLTLTAEDARAIDLRNITGQPIQDYGIASVENGRKAAALVVEQGIRKGDTYVVADIAARDALEVLIGDQVYVLDKGDGEWGMYLYDATDFVLTATEESARTDSRSLSVDIAHDSSTTVLIGEVSSGARVSPVTVEVLTPFDGTPVLTVGDSGNTQRLMADQQLDLSVQGIYESQPAYQYTGGADTEINVSFAANGATQGLARVTITYS